MTQFTAGLCFLSWSTKRELKALTNPQDLSMKKIKKIVIVCIGGLFLLLGYMQYYHLNSNHIALIILSHIKTIKGDAVDLERLQLQALDRPKIAHDDWNHLLQMYVTKAGNVDYQGFIKDRVLLERYLEKLSDNIPGKNWTEAEKLAYWINAYNAFTVLLIINHYPLKSIKDIADGTPMISSPWDIKFFQLAGIDFDLNAIEHQVLRGQFEEPRIHFAINCASVSCPNLRNEAYVAVQLQHQLEQQAVAFVQDPQKNQINAEETKLSMIFNWFESDFNKRENLLSFLRQYHPSIDPKHRLEYLEYNWLLNE